MIEPDESLVVVPVCAVAVPPAPRCGLRLRWRSHRPRGAVCGCAWAPAGGTPSGSGCSEERRIEESRDGMPSVAPPHVAPDFGGRTGWRDNWRGSGHYLAAGGRIGSGSAHENRHDLPRSARFGELRPIATGRRTSSASPPSRRWTAADCVRFALRHPGGRPACERQRQRRQGPQPNDTRPKPDPARRHDLSQAVSMEVHPRAIQDRTAVSRGSRRPRRAARHRRRGAVPQDGR